jgi:ribosomal protein S27AE
MDQPGDYVPDVTEGITRVEDLPSPHIEHRSRKYRRRTCPRCGGLAPRCNVAQRTLHDLSDVRSGRPIDIVVTYSKHLCPRCRRRFNANISDLAHSKCHYTHRVQQTAVRLVVEDGLPYRWASWHLWRDHRVFVPRATIQNWVEAAGGKKTGPHGDQLPGPRSGGLQRLHRCR